MVEVKKNLIKLDARPRTKSKREGEDGQLQKQENYKHEDLQREENEPPQ